MSTSDGSLESGRCRCGYPERAGAGRQTAPRVTDLYLNRAESTRLRVPAAPTVILNRCAWTSEHQSAYGDKRGNADQCIVRSRYQRSSVGKYSEINSS